MEILLQDDLSFQFPNSSKASVSGHATDTHMYSDTIPAVPPSITYIIDSTLRSAASSPNKVEKPSPIYLSNRSNEGIVHQCYGFEE